MLVLRTGVPGGGKSLSAVSDFLRLHREWCKPGNESKRRVVYANIEGLTLPHHPVPLLEPVKNRFGEVLYTPIDWASIEDGSLVLLDEAQQFFPPLAVGEPVPAHIAFLNVHRHRGLDIEVITQHPKNLHSNVRRLVGRHLHLRRVFGWGRAVMYEWDHCQDNLTALKTAVVTQFSYPKEVFQFYKSAEIHTKQTFRKPWWMWLPIAVIPLAAWALPSAFDTLSGAMSGKGVGANIIPAAKPVKAREVKRVGGELHSKEEPVPASKPEPAGGMQAAAPGPLRASGCVQRGPDCRCLDEAGVKLVRAEPRACLEAFGDGPPKVVPESLQAEGMPELRAEDGEVLRSMRSLRDTVRLVPWEVPRG